MNEYAFDTPFDHFRLVFFYFSKPAWNGGVRDDRVIRCFNGTSQGTPMFCITARFLLNAQLIDWDIFSLIKNRLDKR
jgi:hypothetical protein